MNENNLMKTIQLALGKMPNVKMFRNNVGMGWIGKMSKNPTKIGGSVANLSVRIDNARVLHAGLCQGSSDLIGWSEVVITPDMIGRKLAIFTALEIKTDVGRATPEQKNFLQTVAAAGGIAGIVQSPDGAINIISYHTKK